MHMAASVRETCTIHK